MGDSLVRLQELGQSPWLDFITRDLLRSGRLADMIAAGHVTGLTSNPTIFEQAITRGADYDDALASLVRAGKPAAAIVDTLTIEDIRAAADLFAPIYARTKRADGYVSLEVDPTLAHDAAGTVREARRLWRAVNRPNLMVKIPATRAGIVAIEETIASGINVNVTLVFSPARHAKVMDAYVAGLTRRLEAGTRVDRIASVASFFVSRVDTAIDRLLEARRAGATADRTALLERLRGQAAIANATLAYAAFRERFGNDRFALLAREGARPQRPLWASTSTKNPAYPDVYYVEALVGADTVNTLPPATLDAYLDHGRPEARLHTGLGAAREVLRELAAVGISLDRVTDQLEADGVASFVASWRTLVDAVGVRREAALVAQRSTENLGSLGRATDAITRDLDGATRPAIGELGIGSTQTPSVAELVTFADEVRGAGFTHAVLCGTGAVALAPEVLRRSLGVRRGFLDLAVLDSTDPAAVLAVAQRSDPARTLYLVAATSKETVEVQAFLAFFWERLQHLLGERAGEHLIAITDRGTGLEAAARERRFRRVFLNASSIDDRHAALSPAGLVPAALMGHDVEKLLARARRMLVACGPGVRPARNPGARLGAILAAAARAGRDKLTFVMAEKIGGFADWAEHLLAATTTTGLGIVPVTSEPLAPPAAYGADRVFVAMHVGSGSGRSLASHARAGHPVLTLRLADAYDLAAEFVRWEVATAAAEHLLGADALHRPAGEAGDRMERLLAEPGRRGSGSVAAHAVDAADVAADLWRVLSHGPARRYVAITAYVAPTGRRTKLLGELRMRLRKQLGIATTLAYGPRALHATGNLHTRGPANVVVLQLTADDPVDLPVPGTGYSFGTLKAAQATSELEALADADRKLFRIHLGRDVERGLERLLGIIAHRPRPAKARRAETGRASREPLRASRRR